MSWALMAAKGNKERKLRDIKKYFDRSISVLPCYASENVFLHVFGEIKKNIYGFL